MLCAPTAEYDAAVREHFRKRGSDLSACVRRARSKSELMKPCSALGAEHMNYVMELWFDHPVVRDAVELLWYPHPKRVLYSWAMQVRSDVEFFVLSMLYWSVDLMRRVPGDVLAASQGLLKLS